MKMIWLFFILLLVLVLSSFTYANIEPVNSTKIAKSVFGGKIITQTEWDKEYPCQLYSDGSIRCDVIKPTNLITLSSKYDTSQGIPITDYRKPIFEIVQEPCIIPKETKTFELSEYDHCVDGVYKKSVFTGEYEKVYADYTKEITYRPNINQNGQVKIGFATNSFTITDFIYGSTSQTSVDTTVELSNTHADTDASIIGWWQFTDDCETDSSEQGNNILNIGSIHIHEKCLFENDGERININDTFLTADERTWSYWVWISDSQPDNNVGLISTDAGQNRFSQFLYNGASPKQLKVQYRNNTSSTQTFTWGGIFNENGWTHITLTFNDTHICVYSDGSLVNCQTSTILRSMNIDNTVDHYIGFDNWNAAPKTLNGSIDEVVLYNRSLNATEVLALYNKGLYHLTGNYTTAIYDAGATVDWTTLNTTQTESYDTNITWQTREVNMSKPYVGQDGLVAFYPLNGTNGCNDFSGNGNHGNATGSTICGGINKDTLFELENVTENTIWNDYIQLPYFDLDTIDFTVCLWFKDGSFGTGDNIIGGRDANDDGWRITQHATFNQLFISADANDYVTSSITSTLGRWTHVCGIWENSKDRVYGYVNGENLSAPTVWVGDMDTSTPARIGINAYDLNGDCHMNITYVSIYNRTLSQDEIIEIGSWQACNLDATHEYCNITSANSRFIQAQATLNSPSQNVTPILTDLSYNWLNRVPPYMTFNSTYSTGNNVNIYFETSENVTVNWTLGNDCATYDYSGINATESDNFLLQQTGLAYGTTYYYNITLIDWESNTANYCIPVTTAEICLTCLNATINCSLNYQTNSTGFKICKMEDVKMILAALIIAPMILGLMFLLGSFFLGEEHTVLKIALFLLAPITFWVSLQFGAVALVDIYDMPELVDSMAGITKITGVVFFVLLAYFLIYGFYKMVHISAQKKQERLEY